MHSGLEPAGCLGDLGWYTIRISLWAMDDAMPTHVTGRMLQGASRSDSDDQVPIEFSGELFSRVELLPVFTIPSSLRINNM